MLSMKMHLIRRPWDLSISHFSLLRSADLSNTVLSSMPGSVPALGTQKTMSSSPWSFLLKE